VQEALLRLLKAGRVRRLDTDEDVARRLTVNAVALTDRDPEAALAEGLLRHDLYHRIARVNLWLPPLRERPEDIGPAAVWMGNRILAAAGVPLDLFTSADLARASARERSRAIELQTDAIDALASYPFPGNLRELESVVERALLLYRAGLQVGAEEIRAALAPARPR
jgi:DNA-binding NtrC family response regulator